MLVPVAAFKGFASDHRNDLILATATPGQPLRSYAGAGWSKAGEFTTQEKWLASIAAESARLASPVRVSLRSSTFSPVGQALRLPSSSFRPPSLHETPLLSHARGHQHALHR